MTPIRDFGMEINVPHAATDVVVFQKGGRWMVGYNAPTADEE